MSSRSKVLFLLLILVLAAWHRRAHGEEHEQYPVISEACAEKVNVMVLTSNGWAVQIICAEQVESPSDLLNPRRFSI